MENNSFALFKASWRKISYACRFELKNLLVKLPRFYEECLQIFAEYSAATGECSQILNNNTRENTIIWNNKDILINGTLIFHYSLFNKEIITLEDLLSDKNGVIKNRI